MQPHRPPGAQIAIFNLGFRLRRRELSKLPITLFPLAHRESPLPRGREDVERGVLAGDEQVARAGAHRPHLARQQRVPVAPALLRALALEQVHGPPANKFTIIMALIMSNTT